MSRYNSGDVVLVQFPYREDRTRFKKRPAIIIREDTQGEYLICQITGTDRRGKNKGYWIEADSEDGKQMKLQKDSFVNADMTTIVDVNFYINRKNRFRNSS